MAKNLPNDGKGRPPGIPNKLTSSVRECFKNAFLQLQTGEAALDKWALKNPAAFYTLAAKLIPAEVNLSMKGVISERLLSARRVTGKLLPDETESDDDLA